MNMIRKPQTRISDAQAQRILDMIEKGDLKEGDKLPGQRELSIHLNISRSSIREAIRHLEALGILETRGGLGTYVIRVSPRSETYFVDWLQTHQDEVVKIFEVREALESKAAERAAIKATPAQIEALKQSVEEMERAVQLENFDELVSCDIAFHNLIVDITNNELLCQIIHDIQDALRESRAAVLRLPQRGLKSAKEHRLILNGIEQHDVEQAKKAMIFHLRNAIEHTNLRN
jgi:GntR family transcriptional regulator, transcriptional repressor for pyruvate dehydrogenase complex